MSEECSELKRETVDLEALYEEAFDAALAMGRGDLVEALVESIATMFPISLAVARSPGSIRETSSRRAASDQRLQQTGSSTRAARARAAE